MSNPRETAGLRTLFDGHGGKVEHEFMMCVHCQGGWIPAPGSGTQRGFCLSCNGVTCNTDACLKAGCNGSAARVFEQASRVAAL